MRAWGACALLAAGLAALPGDATRADERGQPVAVTADKDAVTFMAGKTLVARYHVGPQVAKPYLWPLNAPGGVTVTRAWPMEAKPGEKGDHPHQKSAWFCHGDVMPEGVELKQKVKGVEGVDFWSEAPGHGVIACVQVGTPKMDGTSGSVETLNEWRTADGVKIMDEKRTVTLRQVEGGHLLVFDIELTASVCPITFEDTKEGSFGVRVRDELTVAKGKGRLVNAEGHTTEGEKNNAKRDGVWGLRSDWCDYSGKVDGKTVGVAVFADPKNAYPSCWHARNYGLLAANPFGRDRSGFPDVKGKADLVKLKKGDRLTLRYAIFTHPGDEKEGKVAEAFKAFVALRK
jgi:hypothetical protein